MRIEHRRCTVLLALLALLALLPGCADDAVAEARSGIWVSGDVHLHQTECAGRHRTGAELVAAMAAAGIDVASSLVHVLDWSDRVASFDGKDDPASTAERLLHSDLEVSGFAAAQAGHLVILGLPRIDFAPDPLTSSRPRSGLPIVDWAHAQGDGVVVGYAHAWGWPELGYPPPPGRRDCCTPFELPISATEGKVAFLADETNEQNMAALGARLDLGPLSNGGYVLWRTLLNTGFRIALAGGTDNGCLTDTFGLTRTFALVDGHLDYDAYLDAVRRGRTMLSSSATDRIDVSIGAARIGGEVALAAPGPVTLTLTSDVATDTPAEILLNGVVAARTTVAAGQATSALSIDVANSSWLALRTKRLQTSPIYVLVGGAPIRASADDACYLVKYVDHLKSVVLGATRPEQGMYLAEERASTFTRYDAARDELMRRFHDAGGKACD